MNEHIERIAADLCAAGVRAGGVLLVHSSLRALGPVPGGAETVRQVEALGGDALFVHCDVTSSAQVQEMVRRTVERFGRLDILVNDAVWDKGDAAVADLDEEGWDRTLAVTLKGPFLCSKYALPHMVRQGGGAIVNISSGCGVIGCKGSAAYSSAKGGLGLLTRSMAINYGEHNIRVNAIAPGYIATAQTARSRQYPEIVERTLANTPMQRYGEEAELKGLAVYLASGASSFMTGSVVVIDGGITIW
jgi:NAD(P)-dependent dehydrogenase (short-subunit alcohol dehydrogenase family)